MTPALLVAIHDVAPPHLAQVARMRGDLAAWGVNRVTLLVVPNWRGQRPLDGEDETLRWLRARVQAGDEVALHGYCHQQRHRIVRPWDRLRARMFTDKEGECLALAGNDLDRMMAAKSHLERLLDTPVTGFVAPAWLEPAGFREALRATQFGWHEGGLWMERLGRSRAEDRRVLMPAVGFATRTPTREDLSLLWARSLGPWLRRRARPFRLALHPPDWSSQRVRRAAERISRALTPLAAPRTCGEAMAAMA